jgi:hypothetical protein
MKTRTLDKNSFTLFSGVVFSSNLNPEPIDLGKFTFNSGPQFDRSGYTICNEFIKSCQDLSYLPNTKTFVLTNDAFCQLVEQNQLFIDNVSNALSIDKNQAISEIAQFFKDKTLLVQQKGLQGHLYNVGTFAQTAGSATMVSRTIVMAKAAGVTGLKIIQVQPFMLVVLPTVGAMFFHGCGSLAGNNTVGRTCNTIGNILNLPMSYCESVYNLYLAPVVNRTIGIPTVLNYTKQAMRGPGLDSAEAIKLLYDGQKKSILKTIKCFLIKKLGGKCT